MPAISELKDGNTLKYSTTVYFAKRLGTGLGTDTALSQTNLIKDSFVSIGRDVSSINEQVAYYEDGGESMTKGSSSVYLGLKLGTANQQNVNFETENKTFVSNGKTIVDSHYASKLSFSFFLLEKNNELIRSLAFKNPVTNGLVGIGNDPENANDKYMVTMISEPANGKKIITTITNASLTFAPADDQDFKGYTVTVTANDDDVQSGSFNLGYEVEV